MSYLRVNYELLRVSGALLQSLFINFVNLKVMFPPKF